jgi:nitroreductase
MVQIQTCALVGRFELEFEKVVLKRRMVRNFQPKPVSQDKVDRILEFAQHAPSAGFSQGWAYVVVTEQGLKGKVGEVQGEADFYAGKRFHKFVSEAPVLIVACASEKMYHDRYREPDKLKEDGTEIEWPVPYWYFDLGCACMLILLAAVDEGLAAAFTGVFRADELRKLLGIPEHVHPVGVISIGYPAEDVKSPSLKRGRRPFTEVVHYEHW